MLPAFAQDTNKVLKVLNSQERATREAIKNTGVVFDALTERGDQLAQWIDNSNDLLRTTGQRDDSHPRPVPGVPDLHRRVQR